VIARFKERVGIVYTRMQFKNIWDKLKQDCGIWKKLKQKETGLGWDESGKNIVMPEDWWKNNKSKWIIAGVISIFFIVHHSKLLIFE
jgi:hypothetical protein